jgi:hypothetical protein
MPREYGKMSALENRSASTPIYRRRRDESAAELIAAVT